MFLPGGTRKGGFSAEGSLVRLQKTHLKDLVVQQILLKVWLTGKWAHLLVGLVHILVNSST